VGLVRGSMRRRLKVARKCVVELRPRYAEWEVGGWVMRWRCMEEGVAAMLGKHGGRKKHRLMFPLFQ